MLHNNQPMKTIYTLTILLFTTLLFSQNMLSGKVVDVKSNPISTVSVYIEGSLMVHLRNEMGRLNILEPTPNHCRLKFKNQLNFLLTLNLKHFFNKWV